MRKEIGCTSGSKRELNGHETASVSISENMNKPGSNLVITWEISGYARLC